MQAIHPIKLLWQILTWHITPTNSINYATSAKRKNVTGLLNRNAKKNNPLLLFLYTLAFHITKASHQVQPVDASSSPWYNFLSLTISYKLRAVFSLLQVVSHCFWISFSHSWIICLMCSLNIARLALNAAISRWTKDRGKLRRLQWIHTLQARGLGPVGNSNLMEIHCCAHLRPVKHCSIFPYHREKLRYPVNSVFPLLLTKASQD
jgi:hypothetical protein